MAGFDVESPELPLMENTFIEASAGTGKTHAIKTLLLRFLIEKRLKIDQILVVTFTRLATLELKRRIREALQSTYFLVESEEPLPEYLLPYVKSEEGRLAVLRILKGALSLMESAKIMTIHGFSASLINQYKNFDGGFSEASIASLEQLRSLIKDFLRTELLVEEVSLWQQELLLNHYRGDFEALVEELGRFAVRRIPIDYGASYQERLASIQKKMEPLKGIALVEQLVAAAPFYKELCTKAKEVKEAALEEFKKFADLVAGKEENFIFKELFKFLPKNLKKGKDVQPLYTELFSELQELNDPLLIFAAVAERARLYLAKVLEKERVLFYEDLLLTASRLVDKAEVQKGVREEFSVALIDEFQDTDAVQWHIFSTLFLEGGGLVVVGDPKQSIYRFRLADLYTYIKAKESFPLQFTLTTNYRSKPRLVEGLNALFAPVKEFLILPERQQSFPCPRVEAKAAEGEDRSTLHLWAVESEEQLFKLVARELIELREQKGVQLSDCALLVKDRHQMKRLKSAFESFSLPLITIKEEAITESLSCALLVEVIAAFLDPRDLSKNGKILLSPFFGFFLEDIEEVQIALLPLFFRGGQLLEERGLLVAINFLMEERGEFLLSQEGGARIYSDLMQLVELAVEEEVAPNQLLDFYRKLALRLEAHEKLKPRPLFEREAPVAMTIHMSKGLEFEVVFPVGLIASFIAKRELIYSSTKGCYLLGEGIEEQNAEKMRLFYVAVTRAKSHLYIPYIEGKGAIDGRSSSMDFFMSKRDFEPTRSFVGEQVDAPLFFEPPLPSLSFKEVSCNYSTSTILSFSSRFAHKPRPKAAVAPSFPMGSEVGTLLHLVLEKISFKIANKELLRGEIAPILENTLLAEYIDPIGELLFESLHLPLKSDFALFSLSQIAKEKMQKEVVFTHIEGERGSKGVIDLFFEYEGRYYFIDWKSNYLDSYDHASMEEEMEAYFYYEQAKLYKEALARYLVLFDQRPFEELFGGFFYIFLRGPGVIYGR